MGSGKTSVAIELSKQTLIPFIDLDNLIEKNEKMKSFLKSIYGVEILDDDKKLFFYEWHVQKGSDKDCNDCWFTSAVSQPFDQGNTI